MTLSGNATFSLSPASSGPDASILIFQSRDNPRALTISGNGSLGLFGTLYAPDAQVMVSGNAQLNLSIVADESSASGNSVANAATSSELGRRVGYRPDQVHSAYGINNVFLDGTGQTIAIVDAYDNPSIYLR